MANYVAYSKMFKEFNDAYEEVIKCVPALKPYLAEKADQESRLTEKACLEKMLESFAKNMPVQANANYPYTFALKADFRGINFARDTRIRFGWNTRRLNEKDVVYFFYISVPNAKEKSIAEKNLIAASWEAKEYETKKKYIKNNKNHSYKKTAPKKVAAESADKEVEKEAESTNKLVVPKRVAVEYVDDNGETKVIE